MSSPTPPAAFHFTLALVGDPQNLAIPFQEVQGINHQSSRQTLSEGGENRFVHTLPTAIRHSNISLRRGLAPRSALLMQWTTDLLESASASTIKPRTLLITLQDDVGQPQLQWRASNAYPVRWQIGPSQSNQNTILIDQIDFAYTTVEVSS